LIERVIPRVNPGVIPGVIADAMREESASIRLPATALRIIVPRDLY